MPIMEIKILPLGTGSASVGAHVARAVRAVKGRGIKCRLTPMGTIIEGPSLERLLKLAAVMHRAALTKDVRRVVTFIEIDERTDKRMTMQGKMRSLKGHLDKTKT